MSGGKGVWRCGKREIIYLSLHYHHQNDFCIKMGRDESHLNVSIGSDGQSHKTVSTNHNLFEAKGEPKRYRTEVLPLTSLTPYRWAKPAHAYFLCFLFAFVPSLGIELLWCNMTRNLVSLPSLFCLVSSRLRKRPSDSAN